MPHSPSSAHSPSAMALELEALREQIRHHDELYYQQAKPEISDTQYDELLKKLLDLEAAHPELVTPDSPSQRVGGRPVEGFASVRHALRMMSIDNTYSEAEVRDFDTRIKKYFGSEAFAYTCEPKIDGVSISLRYERGIMVQAATRGDGTIGDDVTANARTIRNIPLRLKKPEMPKGKHRASAAEPDLFAPAATNADAPAGVPSVLEVRGEVYMTREQFLKLNQQQEDAGEEPYVNPRNTTAGSLKQLDSRVVASRKLEFLPHGIGQIDDGVQVATNHEWQTYLQSVGFKTAEHFRQCADIEEVLKYIHEFAITRKSLPYDTDGVVVKLDSFAQRDAMGATAKSPRWCIAYKYQPERAETSLKEVIFQVGKTGAISPVAVFDPPVFISGTNVYRASLHNYDEIARKDIRLNDIVLVEKAGEVIPYVVGVVPEKRPQNAKPIERPTVCPSCGSHDVEPDGPRVLCTNPACPAQLAERLRYFAGRNQMDINELGEKVIEKLLAKKYVSSIPDLYRLTHEQLVDTLKREGTKKESNPTKAAQNLLDGLAASKSRGLGKLLAGLGVKHIGNRTAQIVADHFGSLEALQKASLADILRAPDMGGGILGDVEKLNERYPVVRSLSIEQIFEAVPIPADLQAKIDAAAARSAREKSPREMIYLLREKGVAAKSLYMFLHSESGSKTMGELQALGLNMEQPRIGQVGPQILAGQTVVITGTLSKERSHFKGLIESLGGKTTDAVSKSTTFVLAGAEAGSKLDKARTLNVPVLSEEEFEKRIKPE